VDSGKRKKKKKAVEKKDDGRKMENAEQRIGAYCM